MKLAPPRVRRTSRTRAARLLSNLRSPGASRLRLQSRMDGFLRRDRDMKDFPMGLGGTLRIPALPRARTHGRPQPEGSPVQGPLESSPFLELFGHFNRVTTSASSQLSCSPVA